MRTVYNRENCLNTASIDGITSMDISDYGLTDFDFGKKYLSVVRPHEVSRPDLLSLRVFGTVDLWWFLMWFNGFSDPWNDLKADVAFYYVNPERVRACIQERKDKITKRAK